MDYQSSGVNIEAGNEAVKRIGPAVKRTTIPGVLGGLGHFGAFFELPAGYKTPVLVSCTDGVGTKLRIAIEAGILNTVGIDLVAMNVNDLICSGAKPLFFLDYIAVHKLDPDHIQTIIEGIANGCVASGAALVGGEMAEMNDMYQQGDFDLAGFAVGVVEKSAIIDGKKIAPGDNVYALPSSGPHSNGFSLLRKVITPDIMKKHQLSYRDLLTPTRIYVKPLQQYLESGVTIHGLSHITGGGLPENIARILPPQCRVEIQAGALPKLPVFKIIQEEGAVSPDEMFRVFNMGVGMVVITPDTLPQSQDCIQIGKITAGERGVSIHA